MYCFKCGSKMGEYETTLLEGKVYYCEDHQDDHPWLWFKPDGRVTVKL